MLSTVNYLSCQQNILEKLSLGEEIISIFDNGNTERLIDTSYAHLFITCLIQHQVSLFSFEKAISHIYKENSSDLEMLFKLFFASSYPIDMEELKQKNDLILQKKIFYFFWAEQNNEMILDPFHLPYLKIIVNKSFSYHFSLWKGHYSTFLSQIGYDFVKVKPLIDLHLEHQPTKFLVEIFQLFKENTDTSLVHKNLFSLVPNYTQIICDEMFEKNSEIVYFNYSMFHLYHDIVGLPQLLHFLDQKNEELLSLEVSSWVKLMIEIHSVLYLYVEKSSECSINLNSLDLTKSIEKNFIYLMTLAIHIEQEYITLIPELLKYFHLAFEQPNQTTSRCFSPQFIHMIKDNYIKLLRYEHFQHHIDNKENLLTKPKL